MVEKATVNVKFFASSADNEKPFPLMLLNI